MSDIFWLRKFGEIYYTSQLDFFIFLIKKKRKKYSAFCYHTILSYILIWEKLEASKLFFCIGPDSNYFRLFRLYGLCWNYSVLPVCCENIHKITCKWRRLISINRKPSDLSTQVVVCSPLIEVHSGYPLGRNSWIFCFMFIFSFSSWTRSSMGLKLIMAKQ